MRKLIIISSFLFILTCNINNVMAENDAVYVDRMLISGSIIRNSQGTLIPKFSQWSFSDKDKIIFYAANIGIINPSKKLYEVKYVCIDVNGRIIFQGEDKIELTEPSTKYVYLDKNKISQPKMVTFSLKPQRGVLVRGQVQPLESNKDYYVQLFVEKKLIGLSQFSYS